MGTGDEPRGKADDDYQKRSAEPLWVKPEETTFVFVTPRSWPGKTAHIELLAKESGFLVDQTTIVQSGWKTTSFGRPSESP
jgi:hypothetical protein